MTGRFILAFKKMSQSILILLQPMCSDLFLFFFLQRLIFALLSMLKLKTLPAWKNVYVLNYLFCFVVIHEAKFKL